MPNAFTGGMRVNRLGALATISLAASAICIAVGADAYAVHSESLSGADAPRLVSLNEKAGSMPSVVSLPLVESSPAGLETSAVSPGDLDSTAATISITVVIPDVLPPTIDVRTTVEGSRAAGFRVSARAEDNSGVAAVAFYRGDELLTFAMRSVAGEWSATLSEETLAGGEIYVLAIDTSGNVATSNEFRAEF